MTEERITTTEDDLGNTHTTHVVRDGDDANGGSAKWVFLLILVVALGVGAYLLTQTNSAEIAKDNAITQAANDVGDAANQVGDAAQDAADAVSGE